MKRAFTAILLLLTLTCFGQEWMEFQLDSTLSLAIPDNYKVVDTLGQRVINAQIDNGLILVMKLPNKGQTAINVQNEKELVNSYTGFQDGLIGSHKGELIKGEIIETGGLKCIQFSYRARMGDENQIRHCLGIFVNENMYAINFWELESMTKEMAPQRERLFSSIKLPNSLGLKNQMSNSIEGGKGFRTGFFLGKVLGYILIFGTLISIGIWISKGKKRKNTNA
jgi:hypothetical protein